MRGKKLILGLICSLLGMLLLTGNVWAQEKYRLQINNQVGGEIKVSQDGGNTWEKIGQVVIPTNKLSREGFAASTYGKAGRVTAAAVNALHVKVDQQGDKPILFSILPQETMESGFDPKSYFASSSSIFTDIPAGKEIFGGGFTPFVGNQVLVGPELKPLDSSYSPQVGDLLTIIVERPDRYPAQMIFENKPGGKVTVRYLNGDTQEIAQVVKRVSGIGRFTGSHYAETGRIRANHPGVICVSTSPREQIGGFQIIPSIHASHLPYVQGSTQWMVVAPLTEEKFLEGEAPLFAELIQPRYLEGKWLENFLVDVKINNGPWQPMPLLVGLQPNALKEVTHLRILFPLR